MPRRMSSGLDMRGVGEGGPRGRAPVAPVGRAASPTPLPSLEDGANDDDHEHDDG
jgi:hypothetical protein